MDAGTQSRRWGTPRAMYGQPPHSGNGWGGASQFHVNAESRRGADIGHMNIAYNITHVLSVFYQSEEKSMPRIKGQTAEKEDAKLEAKARAVRLQKDLEMQLLATRDPAEYRIIEARIENLKALIRTITNIK